jgi:tetratricopeptide (TPR) repeat protein
VIWRHYCSISESLPKNSSQLLLAADEVRFVLWSRWHLKCYRSIRDGGPRLDRKFIFLILLLLSTFAQAANKGLIQNAGDTVHVEFSGSEEWDYDLSKAPIKNGNVVTLKIDPISEGTVSDLLKFSSQMVKSVKVEKNGPDGKYLIHFEVAEGVENFDYQTDQPSRLIVDFFRQPDEKQKAVVPLKKETAEKSISLETQSGKSLATGEKRSPANDTLVVAKDGPIQNEISTISNEKRTGIFDGGDPDFERFSIKDYEVKEEAILAARDNVYIEFPMLRIEIPYLADLMSKPPIYEIKPKDSRENKEARLLQTLFAKKRYAVFLKTLKWFQDKYPDSEYDEMLKFMLADVHFALWKEQGNIADFDVAMLRYRQAIEKYPQSALVERTWMLMGFATFDRGDALGALRLFQKHIEERPNSANRDLSRLALANCHLKLKNYEEAFKQFDLVESQAKDGKFKFDAAFSKGDVYRFRAPLAQTKEETDLFFRRSIEEYRKALEKYSVHANNYPNSWYNQAESYFGLQDYRKALDVHREFVKRFPSHEYAAFSMTRIGEMLDVLGADKSRVVGAYLETFFRYGESPSALVVRIRLVSQRMKGMKDKEVAPAVEEVMKLSETSQLNKIKEFTTIMVSDGFASRKNYDEAISMLHKYYQAYPTLADKKVIGKRIIKHITDKIHDEVEDGNFIAALSTHGKHIKESWLKSADRIDLRYNLGRAYELAGVSKQADELYRETLNRIFSLKGTPKLKAVAAIEDLPSEEQLNLRLGATALKNGKLNESYEYLKAIKNPGAMNEREQIERVQLAAILMDKKGDPESSVRYLTELIDTWRGRPNLMADPIYDLALMQIKLGKKDVAMKALERVKNLQTESGVVDKHTHLRALEKLADLQMEAKNVEGAIATYNEILKDYEEKKPLTSMRYNLGKIHFDRGELQKAAEVWQELKGKSNADFWYNLAQENLKGAQWGEDYKKYIKRIPAMEASSGDGKQSK